MNQGLTVLGATTEALRCLQCTSPKCMAGCPVGVKVKDFVELIVAGDYLKAAAKIREDNILPAITGRVCPQETQCEGCCILGNKFEPLGIGYLERFVADYERESGQIGLPEIAPPTGKKVAIVGSGPAGLSAAGDLIRHGHRSPSSRPCTRSAACSSTASPSSASPRRSSAARSTSCGRWASISRPTS